MSDGLDGPDEADASDDDNATIATLLSADRRAGDGNYYIVCEDPDGSYYAMKTDGSAVKVKLSDGQVNVADDSLVSDDSEKDSEIVTDSEIATGDGISADSEVNSDTSSGSDTDDNNTLIWTKSGSCLYSSDYAQLDVGSDTIGAAAISTSHTANVIVSESDSDGKSSIYCVDFSGEGMARIAIFYALVLDEEQGIFTSTQLDTVPENRMILVPVKKTDASDRTEVDKKVETEGDTPSAGFFEQTVEENGVSVSASFDDGTFPGGTQMEVSPILDEEQLRKAQEAADGDNDVIKTVGVDISFWNEEDGEKVKVQPAEGKKVKVTLSAEVSTADSDNSEEGSISDITSASGAEKQIDTGGTLTVKSLQAVGVLDENEDNDEQSVQDETVSDADADPEDTSDPEATADTSISEAVIVHMDDEAEILDSSTDIFNGTVEATFEADSFSPFFMVIRKAPATDDTDTFEVTVKPDDQSGTKVQLASTGTDYSGTKHNIQFEIDVHAIFPNTETDKNKCLEITLPYGMSWRYNGYYSIAYTNYELVQSKNWYKELKGYYEDSDGNGKLDKIPGTGLIDPYQQTDDAKKGVLNFKGVDSNGKLYDGAVTLNFNEGVKEVTVVLYCSTCECYTGETGLDKIEKAIDQCGRRSVERCEETPRHMTVTEHAPGAMKKL